MSPVRVLTRRQAAVMDLVIAGLTDDQIAHRLAIAIGTVRFHRSLAEHRLDADSPREAIAKWAVLRSRTGAPKGV